MLYLAQPWWLLLLPLPLAVWGAAMWLRHRNRIQAAALIHPDADLLAQLARSHHRRRPWSWLAGCTLLFMALAEPRWLGAGVDDAWGRNIVLAVDASGSMRAMDYQLDGQPADRLTVIRELVNRFISERRGDRIGVVVFGDDAYTLSPLTPDYTLARQLMEQVTPGIAGEKTALGKAVALGIKRLEDTPLEGRVLIVLSDGTNTAGRVSVSEAARMAADKRVTVYTVGIGRSGRVPFPGGPLDPVQLAEATFDEASLRELAHVSGGTYFSAADQRALAQILETIDKRERVELPATAGAGAPLFPVPLALALLLLAVSAGRSQRAVAP